VIETTGKLAEKVVNGFAGSPALLFVAILNIVLIIGAGYAVISVAKMATEGRTQITNLLQTCIASKEGSP
jgi:hypothetical protein